MNSSSEAAETVVNMGLKGTDYALRITGTATKQIAAIILAILKDKKQTKGKTSLTKMLKSGKPLNVFSVKNEDLKIFQREAKRYGILYTALVDKNNISPDGMVDILVREEDAPKINRIVERFDLANYDKDKILKEVNKDKKQPKKSKEERIIDEIIAPEKARIEIEKEVPSLAKTEKSPLSEQPSTVSETSDKGTKSKKPSVRKELNDVKEDLVKTDKKERPKSKGKKEKTNNKTRKTKVNKNVVKKSKKKVKGR